MSRSSIAWIGMILAAALVVVLAWQNRGLRADRDWLSDRAHYAYPGMYVPEIGVDSLQGAKIALGSPAGDFQVLFFFNETCPHCRASAPAVSALAPVLRDAFADRVALIGICECDDAAARRYADAQRFDFPVASLRDRRALMLFRAQNVPLLLAIGRDGRVRHAVQGTFSTQAQRDALLAALRRSPRPPGT